MTTPYEAKQTIRVHLRAAIEEVRASIASLQESLDHLCRELNDQAEEETRWQAMGKAMGMKKQPGKDT